MIIAKILLCFVFFIVIPELIGLLILHCVQIDKKVMYAFIMGYIIEFALCQLITVPFIYMELPFTLLFYLYVTCLLILSIISLIINIKSFKELFMDYGIKNIGKISISSVIVFILIFIQTFTLVKYAHIDDDDAFYVSTSVTTVDTNTLFKYNATTGNEYDIKPKRYTFGPFPIYVAIASKFVHIQPAILAHTVLPIVFIPIAYLVYALIANELFKENKKKENLFLIFLAIIYIFGNYTAKNIFSFLLFRIWQGKAILANIIIPMCYLWFINLYKNKFSFIYCFIQLLICLAGCLTSTMGVIMPLMIIMVLSLIYCLKDKKFRYLIYSGITCIPCFIYGILYFI